MELSLKPKSEWELFPFLSVETAVRNKRPNREDYAQVLSATYAWVNSIYLDEPMRQYAGVSMPTMKFVDVRLEKESRQHAERRAVEEPESVLEELNQLVTEGYRFTVVYDRENDCIIVSLMGKETSNPNYGLCMTTRHRTILPAFSCMLQKHYHVFGGEAWRKDDSSDLFG